MVTIKSYTDLEQSKKLAEILPPESADMYYPVMEDNIPCKRAYPKDREYLPEEDIECWSLAALIEVLPSIEGFKPVIDLDINQIRYEGKYRDELTADDVNLIDACYGLIIKLKENNLI